jgi:spore maturation protein CgeB
MRILLAILKYDYGEQSRGYSFEHYNFYDSLLRMGNDILYFDVGKVGSRLSKDAANRVLIETVNSEDPDALVTVLFRDELDPKVLDEISQNTRTATIGWFSDDHWRFDNYSRFWARHFNWVVTTSGAALHKYHALGQHNVIRSQWACNPAIYTPMDVPKRFDVSFVGLPHGNRRYVVRAMLDAGIDVQTFGKGWPAGRLTQEQMIRVFNESRVNLNLANAAAPRGLGARGLAALQRALAYPSVPRRIRQFAVGYVAFLERVLRKRARGGTSEQIKGRNFEVPGCGGFLLTAAVQELEQYYQPGVEVGVYAGTLDLINQVRALLAQPDLRESVAQAGYARTMREHTYSHRFASIFQAAGLPYMPVAAVLAGEVRPGMTQDVV